MERDYTFQRDTVKAGDWRPELAVGDGLMEIFVGGAMLPVLPPLCGSQFHDLLNDWRMWSFSNLKLTFEKTREKPWSENDHTNMISNGQVAFRMPDAGICASKVIDPRENGVTLPGKGGGGLRGYLENMFNSWPGYSSLMKCFISRSIVFLDWGCRHGLADYRWICRLTVSLICVFVIVFTLIVFE